jgi:hypothetical protein
MLGFLRFSVAAIWQVQIRSLISFIANSRLVARERKNLNWIPASHKDSHLDRGISRYNDRRRFWRIIFGL